MLKTRRRHDWFWAGKKLYLQEDLAYFTHKEMSNTQDNTSLKLLNVLLEGYAWGLGRAAKGSPVSLQDLPQLAERHLDPDFKEGMVRLFSSSESGPSLINEIDDLVDKYPAFYELREYIADLLALKLLMETEFEEEEDEDEEDEDPKWTTLEALFEMRGTEMLHMLSYLRECKEIKETPDLDGFLDDFTLDPEADDQEEMFVYEELIRQRELVDAPLKQVLEVGNEQENDEMRELFTPLILFFREQEAAPGQVSLAILNQSELPALHAAIYRVLCAYYRMRN